MQDHANELLRTLLPRTRVNKQEVSKLQLQVTNVSLGKGAFANDGGHF